MQRVVVTGTGLVTPLGFDLEEVWQKICRGKSGIRKTIVMQNFAGVRTTIAGECWDFAPEKFLPPHEIRRLEPFVRYALAAAIQATNDAQLDFDREDRDRCAVIVGTGIGGLSEIEAQHLRILNKGPSKVSPFGIPKMMPNSAAGNISIHFGLTGPSYATVAACASSINAIADAVRMIRCGECDIVLAGGAEASVNTLGMTGFMAMRALSERNEEPEKASRPFDKDRAGFVQSDGAGILVLESLEHAQKRGAKIWGEILGTGLTSDATHITQPDSNGTGAMKAIQKTLVDAKISPEEIDYINAHGTGTQLGDLAETRAIKRAFGEAAYNVAISSTKSQMGHLIGASGAVETIFCLLAIRDGIVPPTINLDEIDPECDPKLNFVPHTAQERRVSVALSNSFGFGGHNACVIVSALKHSTGHN